MDYNLINYLGVDLNYNDNFDYVKNHLIEGIFKINDSIKEILTFSVSKEHLNYKVLESFYETNLEGVCIFGNIIIINNKFDLSFEYGTNDEFSKIGIFNKVINSSTFFSLKDVEYSNLEITLLVNDLYSKLISDTEIFYSIDLSICVSEM